MKNKNTFLNRNYSWKLVYAKDDYLPPPVKGDVITAVRDHIADGKEVKQWSEYIVLKIHKFTIWKKIRSWFGKQYDEKDNLVIEVTHYTPPLDLPKDFFQFKNVKFIHGK